MFDTRPVKTSSSGTDATTGHRAPAAPSGGRVAVVGAGGVGAAAALSLIHRGSCREIVLVDADAARARGVALDMTHGAPLSPAVDVVAGDWPQLAGADLVVVTAGSNERAGGAVDRSDPAGRLRLLDVNAANYHDIVPRIAEHAPDAVVMVVTDPPDPLADLARGLVGHERVFSTGTFLDSLRFRVHLARRLAVRPADVDALVVGEHGTSQVLLWSSATVGGLGVTELLAGRGLDPDEVRRQVEDEIRYANIDIIDGTGASRYGIGAVTARLTEAVLRDERAVLPVGAYHPDHGVTLSLVGVLGRDGVERMHHPRMTGDEHAALLRSADALRVAARRCRDAGRDDDPPPGRAAGRA